MKKMSIVLLMALAACAVAQDAPESAWHYSEKANPMEPTKATRIAILDSDEPGKATLAVRCTGSRRTDLEVWVDTDGVVEERGSVRLKFDEEKPHDLVLWSRSADYSSIFFGRPEVAMGQITHSQRLIIEWYPFEKAATTASFSGLSSVPITDCRSGPKAVEPVQTSPAPEAIAAPVPTKPNPDIRTKTPTPVSTKPDAFAGTGKSAQDAPESAWHYSEKANPMEPTKATRIAILDSDEPGKATLAVRCTGSRRTDLEVWVDTDGVVEERGSVRLKFDEEKPHDLVLWNRSADYSSIFFGRPEVAMGQITHSQRLIIEWYPFEKAATTASFSGLSSVPITDCRSGPKAVEPVQTSPAPEAIAAPVPTKPNPDIPTKTPTPVSTKPDAFAGTGKSGAPPNYAIGRVAGEQSDAYRHDSALAAEWWNLREPDVRGSSQSADPKPLANGSFSASEKGSIGAWCDEKPRIRHDGVRIDRITPDGPADQAGLRIGDDILALDGIYLFTVEELMNKMHRYKPGTRVSLRYRRRSTIYDSFVIMGAEETQKTAIKAAD